VSIEETDGVELRSAELENMTVAQIRDLSVDWSEEAPEWTHLEKDSRWRSSLSRAGAQAVGTTACGRGPTKRALAV